MGKFVISRLLFPQSQAVRSKTRHGKNEVDVKVR